MKKNSQLWKKNSGPFNLFGEWNGVMGNVIDGNFSFSANQWSYYYERSNVIDFVPVFKNDQNALILIPQPPAQWAKNGKKYCDK